MTDHKVNPPGEVGRHQPMVVGGPRVFGWECGCGKKSSQTWPDEFAAAYAATVHVRNPDGEIGTWRDRLGEPGRWFRYLILPDYSPRERLGLTAAEVLEHVATFIHIKTDDLFALVGRLERWGTRPSGRNGGGSDVG